MSPDSFYSDSRALSEDDFEKMCESMLADGADIIDIGACSTRPGSSPVTEEDEWELLKPALKKILRVFPYSQISIDTFRASIVERAFDFVGDFIINDISAGEDDTNMLETASRLELPYIAMHKRGNSANMQTLCQYDDVVKEIKEYFINFIEKATQTGIKEIIIDPGFGFAKDINQNYRLLNNLSNFKLKAGDIHCPVMVGISRKSMIYKLLSIKPEEALNATSALHLTALLNGADILRVHDVREAKQIEVLHQMITQNR